MPMTREVVRADARDVGGGPLARRRLRPALDAERALPAAQQRQRRGAAFTPGLARELCEHALEERGALRRARWKRGLRQRDVRDHQALRAEAGVGVRPRGRSCAAAAPRPRAAPAPARPRRPPARCARGAGRADACRGRPPSAARELVDERVFQAGAIPNSEPGERRRARAVNASTVASMRDLVGARHVRRAATPAAPAAPDSRAARPASAAQRATAARSRSGAGAARGRAAPRARAARRSPAGGRAARASSRLATLAQAISSTKATAPEQQHQRRPQVADARLVQRLHRHALLRVRVRDTSRPAARRSPSTSVRARSTRRRPGFRRADHVDAGVVAAVVLAADPCPRAAGAA